MIPLSFAQRRLWFLAQLEGPNTAYNLPVVLPLPGSVDREAVEAALRDVLQRHEALRTVFPAHEGEPYQRILSMDEVSDWHLEVAEVDAAGLGGRRRRSRARIRAADRRAGPRGCSFTAGDDQNVLVVVVHHIAGDGWSMGPLARDLVGGVRGAAARVVRRSGGRCRCSTRITRCGSGICSATSRILTGWLSRQVAYWREALAGVPEELELPFDRPRPAVASHRGAQHAARGLGRACTSA